MFLNWASRSSMNEEIMKKSVLLFSLFALSASASTEYKGSSYNEVLDVIEGRNFFPKTEVEVQELGTYQNGIPQYKVLDFNALQFKSTLDKVKKASKKTLESKVDYYDRIEKTVHTNGVCVAGNWEITEASKYSGYFSQGKKALFLGRISSALSGTHSGELRSFGFAGKIFATSDADEVVNTVNFFTIDTLSGSKAERFLDVSLTNNPSLSPNFEILKPLAVIIPSFKAADSSPTFRPVTTLAQEGASGAIQSPVYMRLKPAASTVKNNQSDFRAEVVEAVRQNNGDLKFDIEVSDESAKAETNWVKLGQISLEKAIISYGCDRRLHFGHPKDDHSNQKNEQK